jgi:hypothetical protein
MDGVKRFFNTARRMGGGSVLRLRFFPIKNEW